MGVSVETLNGLERKITVSIPVAKIKQEVDFRLKKLANKVKIDGFRPGKVPQHLVKQRYADGLKDEVIRDLLPEVLNEAMQNESLTPASMPQIVEAAQESDEDYNVSAVFEVFPEVNPVELNKADVEIVSAKVSKKDVDKLLENLQEENKTWQEVSRKAKNGDKVIADFEGFVDDKPFEGGKAENYEIIIGAKRMIPGFEEGLVGAAKDKSMDLDVEFPEDYAHKALAGKKALFKVHVKAVHEGILPELDEAFAAKFNIKEGGIEALKKDLQANMVRELDRRVSSLNREAIFEKMREANPFDVPNAMVDREIENLKHDMYHRMFGHEHHENEKIPDFPRALFEEQAKRRVHLGLLFSAYVEKHKIEVEEARVDAMIEKIASAYEQPEETLAWYNSKEHRGEIQALVMEEMVAEKMLDDARVVDKKMDYHAVMNAKQDAD